MDQTGVLRVDKAGIQVFRQKIDRLKKPALWLLQNGTLQCLSVKRMLNIVAFHEGPNLCNLDDAEVIRHYRRSRRLIVLQIHHEPKLIENYMPDVLIRSVRKCNPQIISFDLGGSKIRSSINERQQRNSGKYLTNGHREGNARRTTRQTGTKPVRRRPTRNPECVLPGNWEKHDDEFCVLPFRDVFWKKPNVLSQQVTEDEATVNYAIDVASTRNDVRKQELQRGKMAVSTSGWLQRSSFPKFPREPPRHREFFLPQERMKTYRLWDSSDKPSPEVMTKCGFFSPGRGDLVRCFQCGIGLKDWSTDDDPILEHIRVSDNCPFLIAELGEDVIEELKSDVLAPLELDRASFNRTDSVPRASNDLPFPVRVPTFQTMEARLESLKDLPPSVKQSRKSIAVAGFYFTGRGDLCRCFTCDGGLKTWDPADDPMEEHAKHFPSCDYLRHIKGDRYIQEVQRKVHGARGMQPSSAAGCQEQYGASGSSEQRPNHVNTREDVPGAGHHVTAGSSPALERSPATNTVLEMGFSNQAVLDALSRLRLGGNPNPTAQQLANAVMVG